jgi:hypothetical protein
MKASGNLRFLVIHMICRVDMAPINIGTDGQVIIRPQTRFALWTLASVDTNTTMQSLKVNCPNQCQIPRKPWPQHSLFHPQLTVRLLEPISWVTLRPISSLPKFYAIQVPAGSDKWQCKKKSCIMYVKKNILRKCKLVWTASELDQTYGLWPLSSWSREHFLASMNIFSLNQHTFCKQFYQMATSFDPEPGSSSGRDTRIWMYIENKQQRLQISPCYIKHVKCTRVKTFTKRPKRAV